MKYIILLLLSTQINAKTISCTDLTGESYEVKCTKYNKCKLASSDNVKYTVNIKDINNFNELDDTITKSNAKGHKLTLSLTCKCK